MYVVDLGNCFKYKPFVTFANFIMKITYNQLLKNKTYPFYN